MIHFSLKCSKNHVFESWFQSSASFEKLVLGGHLSCIECGDSTISKSLMAPKVNTRRTKDKRPFAPQDSETAKALAKLKSDIEKNSDYVGLNFATEARAMHDGDSPTRSIYGEAKPEEAKALIEDGIPVTPLPFIPKRQTN